MPHDVPFHEIRARARDVDFGSGVKLAVMARKVRDDRTFYLPLAKVEWVETNPLNFIPDDAGLWMPPEAAQALIDDLWRAGYRPKDAAAGDATLQAKNDHIRDLQLATATFHAVVQSALVKP